MKRTLQFVPTYVTLFLILGLITAYFISFHPIIIITFLGLCFVALLILYNKVNQYSKHNIYFGFVLIFLSFIVGIANITCRNELLFKQHYTQIIKDDISVRKNDISAKYHFKVVIDEVLKSGVFHHKYEVEIKEINGKPSIGKVLLNVSNDSLSTALEVDQNLQFYGVFKDIERPKNPYYFDYKEYLRQQQIHHQLFVTQSEIQVLEFNETSIKGLAFQLRKKINEKLKPYDIPADELAVINALLLGQRQDISKELMENYTKAGAIHILAISGLHIGIILMILHFLFKPIEIFKNGKIIKAVLLILLMWMYALVAGLSASVVRAVMMFSLVAIGMNLNKKPAIINTLILSLLILLLINPLFIFNVGFQLSYAAVFAIVTIQPMISKRWNPKNKIIMFFWNLFTVSIAAQFGVLPLSLYYFHQFPGLFIISNLIIIPFLGIILLAGILIFILALLNNLPLFLIDTYVFIIKTMNEVIKWVSLQESFLIKEIPFTFDMMLMLYLFFILGALYFNYQKWNYLKLFLISIVGFQLLLFIHKSKNESEQEMIIFHKNEQSVLAYKKGKKLIIYTESDTLMVKNEKIITAYKIGNFISTTQFKKPQNVYYRNNQLMLVIDSTGIYKIAGLKPAVILLQYSPKINLNRLIDELNPQQIIADGSNYTSYVKLWAATCKKRKTPFHHTRQKGAYIFK